MDTFATETAKLDLYLRSAWSSGLVADLSLTPEVSLSGWTVSFDYAGDITNIWNARIVSRIGDRYIVENMGYNANVGASGTVSFGFQGSGSDHEITPVALLGDPIGAPSDPMPVPVVSVMDAMASEEDGEISFQLELSEPATSDITISYRVDAGSAGAGTDYAATLYQVVIPAGQTSATITLALIDDTTPENTETFALELISAEGADIGDSSAVGTILDSDVDVPIADPVVLTVSGGSVTESDPGVMHMHDDGSSHMHDDGHRYITFTVALDTPAAQQMTLSYATSDGTAVADTTSSVAWDYHEATGALVFAPGEQTQTVVVAVHPDLLVEGTETFTFAVSGENIKGTLEATGSIYDNDTDDTDDDTGDTGGDSSGSFIGGGTTYTVGQSAMITGFDPTRDVLDLGPNSIHNQIPVDTTDGFMMLHMFNASQSTLVQGVYLADLFPESFAPIADGHLQQDMSAVLAWEDGSGLVRPNTVYIRSHEEGLVETVDFDPATDKISFFYLSVRGDGQRNFAVEDTAEGARFFNPLTGQSLTLRDVSFSELDSAHFEWRANQLEDNLAGRMGLGEVVDGFEYVSGNVFSGKSVAMAGGVDRAPYHSQPEYTGTPIGTADTGDSGGGDADTGGDTGDNTGGGDTGGGSGDMGDAGDGGGDKGGGDMGGAGSGGGDTGDTGDAGGGSGGGDTGDTGVGGGDTGGDDAGNDAPVDQGEDVEATLYHVDEIKSGDYESSPNPDFLELTATTHLVQSNDFGQSGYDGHNWGGINPNMYRGFDYAGRDRDIGESIGNGPVIQLMPDMTTDEIEDIINSAPTGATVEFQAGTYWLTETININRGDLHLKGVSETQVSIRADNITTDAAFRVKEGSINGKLGENEAVLITDTTAPVLAEDKIVQLETVAEIEAGDFLEFVYNYNNEANSRVFNGGGDSFNKLSSLVEVDSVNAATNEVILREKVGMDFDPDRGLGNAEVRVFGGDHFIHNLIISDLTIKYMEDEDYAAIVDPHDLFNYNSADYGGAYNNKVSGIRLEAAHESDIINVTIENAGSLGIWVDAGYQVGIQNYTFDGSQNLGGGGNGYGILLDDSFYGDFEGLTIGSVDDDDQIAASRHAVVMGYSSSAAFNNIHYDFANSNLDHHGGLDFGNISYVETMSMTQTDHYNFGVMDDRYVLNDLHYNQIQNTYVFDDVRTQEDGQIPGYVGSLVPGQEDGQGHWANNGLGSSYVDVVYMSTNGGTARTFGKDDEIHSGVGNDELFGGGGDDDFLFYARSGQDIVQDFENGDRIGVAQDANGTGITSASDLLARLSQTSDDAMLDLGNGNTVILAGVEANTLGSDDFFVF